MQRAFGHGRWASPLAVLLAAAALALAVPSLPSCARDEPGYDVQVVDPALLAFLSKARSTHHQADLYEADDDVPKAIEVLQTLVDGPLPRAPKGASLPPEVREVVADTRARLAELRSAAGDIDAAKGDVRRGLELATERTHYRGRLMEVLGVVEQRQHDQLREAGDEAGAKAAKARAIEAFQEAVAIQDEVIKAVLGDGGLDLEPSP